MKAKIETNKQEKNNNTLHAYVRHLISVMSFPHFPRCKHHRGERTMLFDRIRNIL